MEEHRLAAVSTFTEKYQGTWYSPKNQDEPKRIDYLLADEALAQGVVSPRVVPDILLGSPDFIDHMLVAAMVWVPAVRGQYHATSCAPRFSLDLARDPDVKMAATDALRKKLHWVMHEADSGDPDASYRCVHDALLEIQGAYFSSAGPEIGS